MRIAALLFLIVALSCKQKKNVDWPVYHSSKAADHFSEADEITASNLNRLTTVWTYQTGDNSEQPSDFQCNPIVVNGVMYLTSPKLKLIALDAASGKELWKFDPFQNRDPQVHASRGVVYWSDPANVSDQRILFTAGDYLYAINALNGALIQGFGDSGKVSLHAGLDRDVKDLYVVVTTPGIVYQDLLILGSRVSENHGAAPGHVRAYNIRTGKRQWIFHTIPQPGSSAAKTWPADALDKAGGANAWAGFSLDSARDMVFVPTGSAAYDFYGADRHGENLYANCVLALRASTGEYLWHYQTVKHDVWDRDHPCQPVLLTVKHNGKNIDAVAQATKSGYVFLLDRETGKPLFPVEERPVPSSDLDGEKTWPTQLFPTKPEPFARQVFREEDVTNISAASKLSVRQRFRGVRSGGQFVPPSREGTMIFPGFDGGAEWGGVATDQKKGIVYINSNEMPWILTMVEATHVEGGQLGQQLYVKNCMSCHGQDRMGDQHNFPSLIGIEKRMDSDSIHTLLENGRGRMASFRYLSGSERQAIVDYIMGKRTPHSTGEKSGSKPEGPAFVSTGYNRFLDPDGYPAVKPPWGTLNAIDMNKGEILWKVPLGEFEELTQKGVPVTGTENYGGPLLTSTGLIFIAATQDKKIRAFDSRNGNVLWEHQLPAGGYATPCTYMIDGKQYITIAAGGVKMRSAPGDYVITFALR